MSISVILVMAGNVIQIMAVEDYMKGIFQIVAFWFEFTMILIAYIGVVALIAGRGLDAIMVILFVWMLIYLGIKIVSFSQSLKK